MYVIFRMLILLTFTYALRDDDITVCRDSFSGQLICCFNYEEVDNECRECRPGTMSTDGKQCQPCKANVYGYRCLKRCNCSNLQRCDPTAGCVNVLMTAETVFNTSELDVKETTVVENSHESGDQIKTGFLKREVIIYTIGSCLIGIGVILSCVYIIKKVKMVRLRTQEIESTSNLQGSNHLQNPYQHYTEINESMLNEEAIVGNRDSYLIVISGSTPRSENCSQHSHGSGDSYLKPVGSVCNLTGVGQNLELKQTAKYLIETSISRDNIHEHLHSYQDLKWCSNHIMCCYIDSEVHMERQTQPQLNPKSGSLTKSTSMTLGRNADSHLGSSTQHRLFLRKSV